MPKGYPKEMSLNVESVEIALKAHQGVYLRACKDLGVHKRIVSAFVKEHPKLVQLVKELRHHWVEDTCDEAEAVVKGIMHNKENPAVALKAAMFLLNNQARHRGYAYQNETVDEGKLTAAQALAVSQMIAEERKKLEAEFKEKEKALKKKWSKCKGKCKK